MPLGPERMNAIATRPVDAVRADRGEDVVVAACHCGRCRPRRAVRRRRDEDGVSADARRLAVVPRRPDPPGRVDVRGRKRERTEALDCASVVDVCDAHRRRPRRSAVRRSRGGDREAASLEEVDHDEVAVGPDRGKHAHRGPRADVRRRATTSGRRRPTTAPRACPRRPSGCRRGSSGRRRATPRVLSHAIQFLSKAIPSSPPAPLSSAALSAVLQAKPSAERLIASRVTPSPSASVEMSHVPCRASNATAGSLARSLTPGGTLASVRPGRNPLRHVAPSSRRNREADVRGARPRSAVRPGRSRPSSART